MDHIITFNNYYNSLHTAPSGFHHKLTFITLTKHHRATRSSHWGFSKIMRDDSTKISRFPLNEKLIFEDVVAPNSRDTIIFPGEYNTINKKTNNENDYDDNDIDLSGSFTPSSTTTPFPIVAYNLNALCTSYAQMRFLIQLNSNATSGTYTFPNGTQITYARCEVILIKHPD